MDIATLHPSSILCTIFRPLRFGILFDTVKFLELDHKVEHKLAKLCELAWLARCIHYMGGLHKDGEQISANIRENNNHTLTGWSISTINCAYIFIVVISFVFVLFLFKVQKIQYSQKVQLDN